MQRGSHGKGMLWDFTNISASLKCKVKIVIRDKVNRKLEPIMTSIFLQVNELRFLSKDMELF